MIKECVFNANGSMAAALGCSATGEVEHIVESSTLTAWSMVRHTRRVRRAGNPVSVVDRVVEEAGKACILGKRGISVFGADKVRVDTVPITGNNKVGAYRASIDSNRRDSLIDSFPSRGCCTHRHIYIK